jgi:hypothetical protein
MSAAGAPLRWVATAILWLTAVAAPAMVQILLVVMLAESGLDGPFGRMATVEFLLLLQVAAGLTCAVLLGFARLASGRWGLALPLCIVLFAILAVEEAVLYFVASSPV